MLGIRVSESEKSIATDKLQRFLEINSCMVVLDDVWERAALDELLPTLLSGKGRVLITTRNQRIIHLTKIPFHIHRARRLTPEESRELFFKIVRNIGIIPLQDDDGFAELGKKMLEKCDGLPLAIITLGGLLGSKSTIHEWASILKDDVISRIMEDDDEAVKKVLELSYLDLSYHLKPCFLYLGTFKEDAEIDVDQLFNLWIDEGFVNPFQKRERRLKEVAKDCMDELVQRCMVQVVSRDYGGAVEKFRIHDLIRDLCIDKANELNFFQVLLPSTTTPVVLNPQCHRAIICNRSSIKWDNTRLRTLICTGKHNIKAEQLHTDLFQFGMLKQVRVLFLEGVVLGKSANQIGNMVLLRYLRFWNCTFEIDHLGFIKILRNLRTLIFHRHILGRIKELPDNMVSSMEELKVLHLPILGMGPKVEYKKSGVGNLRKLQSLHVQADEWLIQELHTISTDLRELKLCEIKSQAQLDAIYACLGNTLTNLETLQLEISIMYSDLQLGFELEKMKLERCGSLKCLLLKGKITRTEIKPWLFLPPILLSMTLMRTEIKREEDMNEAIAQLGHLRELFLYERSYNGAKLTITGLPQLQVLSLHSLSSLEECSITEGSLPQLRELSIVWCDKLKRIPNGISEVTTLQLLMVSLMPEEFCRTIQKNEEGGSVIVGEDFKLVQHIPTITFESDSVMYSRLARAFRIDWLL